MPKVEASYEYVDEAGEVQFVVERLVPKGFRQKRPDGNGGWAYSVEGTRRVLYRLPRVLEAVLAGQWVTLVEGEKDVEALEAQGRTATTAPGGAGKWRPEYTETLRGAKVALIADADDAGRKHALAVANELDGVVAKLLVYEPRSPHKDVSEHLAAGLALGELIPFDWTAQEPPREPSRREPLRVMSVRELMQTPDASEEDYLLGPLVLKGSRVVVGAHTGDGKALDVATPIPTPAGWKRMLDLQAGDVVYGSNGRPVRIVAVSSVQLGRPCYEVEFSDGARIVTDASHLWTVVDHATRTSLKHREARRASPGRSSLARDQSARWLAPQTMTTVELAAIAGTASSPAIACSPPVEKAVAALPIDPYVLGAWLGDGHTAEAVMTAGLDDAGFLASQFAMAGEAVSSFRADARNPNIITFGWGRTRGTRSVCARGHRKRGRYCSQCRRLWAEADKLGTTISKLAPLPATGKARLRELGVLGDKHIPHTYLEASTTQRLALLQGLVDTDGSVSKRGQVEFASSNERLARDALALALSLGLRAVISRRKVMLGGVRMRDAWRVIWTSSLPVARLPRKAGRLIDRPSSRTSQRYVVAVRPVRSRAVKCIAVDAPDSLYLAGDEYIATHNTTWGLQALSSILRAEPFLSWRGSGNGTRALVLDVEQGQRTVKRRFSEAGLGELGEKIDLVHEPDGLTLDSDARQIAELEGIFRSGRYDVVLADPLYKLHRGDANDERRAVDLMRQFDTWRERYGFALLLPMHCRKPTAAGVKFSIHDILGSTGYTRGAEVVVGLQRVSRGYAFLYWWKDREGDLGCLNERWGLIFDREHGFRRDPKDLERTPVREQVRAALREAPGLAISDLRERTGAKQSTLRRALEDVGAVHGGERLVADRRWSLPPSLFDSTEGIAAG